MLRIRFEVTGKELIVASCLFVGSLLYAQTRVREDQTNFQRLSMSGSGPSRVFLSRGAEPSNTTDVGADGKFATFDVVLFVDVDNKLKIKKSDGTVVSLEP